MPDIFMPRLSDTMEEGTITRWLKQPGDQVNKGDIVAEVETDKANMEIEAYDSGILEQITVTEGETAPIGQTIAIIGSGKGASKQPAAAQHAAPSATQAAARPAQQQSTNGASSTNTPAPAVAASQASESGVRVKASPLARRIAEEHGIDLARIQGTGPAGRIVRDDLEEYLEQQRSQPAPAAVQAPAPTAPQKATTPGSNGVQVALSADDEVVNMTQMQKTIARRLTESKQTVPHFYVRSEVDMTEALALRQRLNAGAGEKGIKISVNDLIVKACALALESFPEVNSSYKDGQFIRHKHINIGIAVDVPNGLVVPVIREANLKGVRTIAREARGLIEKARIGKLAPSDFDGGTFSVSNLGMMDVTDFSAIINPPEAAILAVASARKTYVPIDNQPVLRDLMPLTISADHRVLYGATVARFLQEVKRLLQDPYTLLG